MNIEELLDREHPLNVGLLDMAVQAFYTGDPATQKEAERVLTIFQNHPDTWQQVASILETSQSLHTKFLGLRILDNFITVRWNTVPLETRLEIRNYIVGLVISLTSTANLDLMERTLVTKLNMVLIQILKKDWLQHWVTFIPEIVAASQTNLSLCENNLRILKLLNEEIFDYSGDQMTVARTEKLKAQMKKEADIVFGLCKQVLEANDVPPPSLTEAALATLSRFLVWLPQDFVADSGIVYIIGNLIDRHRVLVLECFTTIASHDIVHNGDGNCEAQIVIIYRTVMDYIQKALPLVKGFALLYEDSDAYDQSFVHHAVLLITTILSKHLGTLDRLCYNDGMFPVFTYLLELSRIEDVEMWRMCLEYWEYLTSQPDQTSSHYTKLHLADIRILILDRMIPPDEVLLVEDDDGEVTKEYIKEGGKSATFKSMKHVLSDITRLDTQGTIKVIQERLVLLAQSENWAWVYLNKLCWAIGAISGTLTSADENSFLMLILEELVRMLEKSSADTRTTISGETSYVLTSCLVYIGTQYVRFIDVNPIFLNLVLSRLFSYMHDSLPGVRDMACDSFMKLCQGCPETLANKIIGNYSAPIVWMVIRDINNYTMDLDTSQMSLVYGALGHLVVSLASPIDRKLALDELAKTPEIYLNQDWHTVNITSVSLSVDKLKPVLTAIKLCQAVCSSTGPTYQPIFYRQLGFYVDIYKVTSKFIRSSEGVEDSLEKRQCQKIKTEIQRLVENVFSHSNDGQSSSNSSKNQLQDLLQVILEDYHALSGTSEPMVLDMMATILGKEELLWPQALDAILADLFEPTLMLINQNFSDYPTHRLGFFRLLRSLNQRYFEDFLRLPSNTITIIVDSILWGTKHTVSDISHVALQTCLDMINAASQLEDEDMASEFYRMYYLRILTETLTILVDPDCQNGFKYQSQLLARMLELVQEGEIYTQVFDTATVDNPLMSNATYLQDYVQRFFIHTFPLLQKDQTEVLVLGMFEYSGDLERFQSDLLDFIIDIRQVDDIDAGNQRRQQQQDAELELLRFV
ncbi:armadillo-type protein [Absidia repens]|uniref:Exportin-1 n=1 Tax=Absidia repens TaxID=90262 RepID=A0A1X2J272_9FUNG|nr:armadillo-type protein [Absidia repens]